MAGRDLKLGMVIGARSDGTVKRTLQGVDNSLATTRKRFDKLRLGRAATRDVVGLRKEMLTLRRAQRRGGQANEGLARKIHEVEGALKKAERAAQSYGVDVSQISRESRRLATDTRRAEEQIRRLERTQERNARRQRGRENRRRAGQALGVAAAGAATAAGVVGGRNAVGFSREAVRLQTAVNASDVEAAVGASREAAIEFALRKGIDAAALLRIEYALNSAGLEADAARAGGRVVAQVARVTQGADERVGEVVASLFNNVGEQLEGDTQQRLARIGDLLTKTQLKFQFRNFDQLGESVSEALPAMIANNVALEESLTLMGLLNGAGLRGSRAGTAFTATLRQMSRASKEFGFELDRGADGALDVIGTLRNLDQAIGGIENIDQATRDKLQSEFGEEGIRMVSLLLPQLEEIPKALDDVDKNAKGIFNRKDRLFIDDPSGQIDRMQKNLGLLAQSIVEAWLPAIGDASESVADLVEGMVSFSRENPGVVQGVTAVAGAMTAAKLATAGWLFMTGRQGKAVRLLALGRIPELIGALGKLRKAKMVAAGTSFLGQPLTKARWATWLGRGGAVAAAGAVGYGIGSAISKAIEGTRISDTIGKGVAQVLAFFGNDTAQAALEADAAAEEPSGGPRATDVPPGRVNAPAQRVTPWSPPTLARPAPVDVPAAPLRPGTPEVPAPEAIDLPPGRVNAPAPRVTPSAPVTPPAPLVRAADPIVLPPTLARPAPVDVPAAPLRPGTPEVPAPEAIDLPPGRVNAPAPRVTPSAPVTPPAPPEEQAAPREVDEAGTVVPFREVHEEIERERVSTHERVESAAAARLQVSVDAPVTIYATPDTNVEQLARQLQPAMDRAAQDAMKAENERQSRRRRAALHG